MQFTKFVKLGAIGAFALALTAPSTVFPNHLDNGSNQAQLYSLGLKATVANDGVINSVNTLHQSNSVKSQHWLNILIPLKLRHQNKLDRLILEQADPGSQYFQKYLTVKQFNNEFAPSAKHYIMLVNFLTSHGINITAVSPNHIFLEVTASVSQLKNVFGQPNVKNNNSRTNKASNFEIYYPVPDSLKKVVSNISVVNNDNVISTNSNFSSYLPPSGWPTGYSPQQIDTVYDYQNSNNLKVTGKTYSGRGVTIAIASISGTYNLNDVTSYWNHYGIARTGSITNIAISKPSHKSSFETTLDVEQVGASAPGANILVYEARHSYLQNAALMLNRIVTDNKADIISCSWGLAENLQPPNIVAVTHEIFKEAAVQGIAIFAASGDSGAYDTPGSNTPSVNFPASDPYVTAVGGTTLVIRGRNDSRDLESAWYGSGGGVSKLFSKPVWQNIPGMPKNKHRDMADVSLDADTNTGYATLYKNHWIEGGGTSFACPNWAAGWSLAIEEAGHRIAMPAIYIYDIANSPAYKSIFYDVKTGSNGNHFGAGFRAGLGYDYPTGWGTPNMSLLAIWLTNYKPVPQPTKPVPATSAPANIGHKVSHLAVRTLVKPSKPAPIRTTTKHGIPQSKKLCLRTLFVQAFSDWEKAGPVWTKGSPVWTPTTPAKPKISSNKLVPEKPVSVWLRSGPVWTNSVAR